MSDWAVIPDPSPIGEFLERMADEGHSIFFADSGRLPSPAVDGTPGPGSLSGPPVRGENAHKEQRR